MRQRFQGYTQLIVLGGGGVGAAGVAGKPAA
ncbi:hypothetical protein ABIB44_003260 [Hymenobacter sp. UYCo722]